MARPTSCLAILVLLAVFGRSATAKPSTDPKIIKQTTSGTPCAVPSPKNINDVDYCQKHGPYSAPPTLQPSALPAYEWQYTSWDSTTCNALCTCVAPRQTNNDVLITSKFCSASLPALYPESVLNSATKTSYSPIYSISSWTSTTVSPPATGLCTPTCACDQPVFSSTTPDAPVPACRNCTFNNYCTKVLGYVNDPGQPTLAISPNVWVPRTYTWDPSTCRYQCMSVPTMGYDQFIKLEVIFQAPPAKPLNDNALRQCLGPPLGRESADFAYKYEALPPNSFGWYTYFPNDVTLLYPHNEADDAVADVGVAITENSVPKAADPAVYTATNTWVSTCSLPCGSIITVTLGGQVMNTYSCAGDAGPEEGRVAAPLLCCR